MSVVPPWVPPQVSSGYGRHSFGSKQFGSPPPPFSHGGLGPGLRSSISSPARSNYGGSTFSGRGAGSSIGANSSPPRANYGGSTFSGRGAGSSVGANSSPPKGSSMSSHPGIHPENLSAAYETCRDEIRVLGRELREAQQKPPTPDAEYWKGQAQLLHSQMQSLYDFAGQDELRMHQEMRHFQGLADGEAIAARWKVAASEAEAQMIAHQTAESAIAGQEWRVRKDTEWLKTRLQAAEEQRGKMADLSEHYKGLACKQLDTIQETNAQVASHRARIRDDESRMQFLENSNGWLVQKLRTTEEVESQLAALVPEAREENGFLSSRLGRTEAFLSEVEARERDAIQRFELQVKSLEDDADMLRGQVWDATNRAGLAEAEMGVMTEQSEALKKKYKGVEDRRTRLAMLEEANKQLRLKIEKLKDQEKLVETLSLDNDKLKRRLKSGSHGPSKAAVAAARSMEVENLQLRSELLEVTRVLEQVGGIPEPADEWRYGGAHMHRRDFLPASRPRSLSRSSSEHITRSLSPATEQFPRSLPPAMEQILSMSVPVASDSMFEFPAATSSGMTPDHVPALVASPKLSPRAIASPKLSARGAISSHHPQARNESPEEARRGNAEASSSGAAAADASLLAAMQNVTRALGRAGLDRVASRSPQRARAR